MTDDLYMKMLQKSIDKQAQKIISEGATEKERYGNLLESVKGRDLEQEGKDRVDGIISRTHSNAEARRIQREKEDEDAKRRLQKIVNRAKDNIKNGDRRKADAFMDKYRTQLDKAHEKIKQEQNKRYFS